MDDISQDDRVHLLQIIGNLLPSAVKELDFYIAMEECNKEFEPTTEDARGAGFHAEQIATLEIWVARAKEALLNK